MITLARGEPTLWGEIQAWFVMHELDLWGVALVVGVLILLFARPGRRRGR